jgi:hypothetical protein
MQLGNDNIDSCFFACFPACGMLWWLIGVFEAAG